MNKNGSSNNLQTQPVPQKQAQITPRVKQSPNSSKQTVNQAVAPSSTSSKATFQAVKRYSMQNSPRGGAKNYNVSQQYQMF